MYKFIKSDGGKSEYKHTGLKFKYLNGDCGPRALAIATGCTYEEAVIELRESAGLTNSGTHFNGFVHSLEWEDRDFHGYRFEWIPFKAVKGQKRMNPVDFCNQYSTGSYICRTARHVFAVVDGILYDTWEQRPDRCIYGAWKVISK